MIDTVFNGVKGKFLTDDEFDSIVNKIKENQTLIAELSKEVGLNEQTI